ncbi:hypothetical protein PybrP1_003741 [[Pythium] brassicae (nom. inval.)]|nr:hypothetical protein PybrP1_003741 [[Pythium] brassicae (nom. inval.)]
MSLTSALLTTDSLFVATSNELRLEAQTLGAEQLVRDAQTRFSDFTSAWRLCQELLKLLAIPLSRSEFVSSFFFDFRAFESKQAAFEAARLGIDAADCSSSVASLRSTATRNSRVSASSLLRPLLGHSLDGSRDALEPPLVKLETLEEHRFATRFQAKRVTPRTWRKAKNDAYKLIALQERAGLVEALYLLLEILSLRPKGCHLSALYLNAGSIYLTFDHLEDAAKAYRNCLRLDPTAWKARFNLGVALARAQDFVDAKRQLDLAALACGDADVVRDIHEMVREIEGIVRARSARAFKSTQHERAFTSQYLEGLHTVAEDTGVIVCAEDYTVSYHSSPPRRSPLLLHQVQGWQGAVAGLVHRLFAVGYARSVSIDAELTRADASGSDAVTIEQLEAIVRANRSEKARAGGLWHWMELSMTQWVRQLDLPAVLVQALGELGWMTPMDLALRSSLLDPAAAALPLSFAGRGVFVFECHRTKRAIANDASVVLQMFFRRLVHTTRRAASFMTMKAVSAARGSTHTRYSSAPADIKSMISESTVLEQEIAARVLNCLDALVDAVVARIRLECREDEERIRWQEIPVRTEKRQATAQAVETLQQLMARKVS